MEAARPEFSCPLCTQSFESLCHLNVHVTGAHAYERCPVPVSAGHGEDIELSAFDNHGTLRAEAEGLMELREITVDSGAGEPVINPKDLPGVPLVPTEQSKGGKRYVGPGGELIPNLGELTAGIMTENGVIAKMKFQGASVRKPLLAVSAVSDKGNMTVFDEQGSFIIPKNSKLISRIRQMVEETDHKIPLHRKNGVYNMRAWMMPKKGQIFPGRGVDSPTQLTVVRAVLSVAL